MKPEGLKIRLALSGGFARKDVTANKPGLAALGLTHETSTLRLALTGNGSERQRAPFVRLAMPTGNPGENCLTGARGVERIPDEMRPSILVSFPYLAGFLRVRERLAYCDWALDSGAFSAFASGATIDLQAYIDTCKELLATDPTLTEVFALDVIGDWRATLANTEEMWKQGVPAIPAWHAGSPEDVLLGLARDYPKIAFGGLVPLKGRIKLRIIERAMARVWPKKVHGFGLASEKILMQIPFHSTDATNWELGACKFGSWKSFGKLSVRGSKHDLRPEIDYYLKLERKIRSRWSDEMEQLEQMTQKNGAVWLPQV